MPESPPNHMEEVCKTLIREAREQFYVMNESWFVRDLLPMLAGETNGKTDLNFWVQRVGYYQPIRVFADSDLTRDPKHNPRDITSSGLLPKEDTKALFEIPPLILNNGRKFEERKDDRDSVYEDMLSIENRVKNNPRAAMKDVERALHSRLKPQTPEAVLRYGRAINAILARYNKPLLHKDLGTTVEGETAAAPETDFYGEGELGVEFDDD